jgi:hypothetical protein
MTIFQLLLLIIFVAFLAYLSMREIKEDKILDWELKNLNRIFWHEDGGYHEYVRDRKTGKIIRRNYELE